MRTFEIVYKTSLISTLYGYLRMLKVRWFKRDRKFSDSEIHDIISLIDDKISAWAEEEAEGYIKDKITYEPEDLTLSVKFEFDLFYINTGDGYETHRERIAKVRYANILSLNAINADCEKVRISLTKSVLQNFLKQTNSF